MAVFTKINTKDISYIESQFNLGEIKIFKGIKKGIENTNYLIQTKNKKYILTIFEKRIHGGCKSKDLPFFMNLMSKLSKLKIKCPEPIKNKNLAFVTQTTLSIDDTKEIIEKLRKKFPKIKEPKKEDICYATTNRQTAVKTIAKKCEMLFIIGSRNSSNSVRLVEVAKNSGCPSAELIHSESPIPFEKIANCSAIGVSSGASAPEILVDEFINNLKKKFVLKIEEIEIIKEEVTFKIPTKLN